ncbi:nuclear transport factor 2 family protein [Patescibacteria group bacterium]|nr:nuclear transport factor 2 family protein [Patescibacteria group bacterium]
MNNVENNKKIAVQFLEHIVNRKIDEAYQLVNMDGKHHSPFYPAGFSALQKGMKENDGNIPEKKLTVHQVIAEDNMVSVFVHLALKPYEMAVVYIFKFKDGKIDELWDCGMSIPEEIKNKDGIF